MCIIIFITHGKPLVIKTFGEVICKLLFCNNMLQADNLSFNELSKEMMPNVYVFGMGMLHGVL